MVKYYSSEISDAISYKCVTIALVTRRVAVVYQHGADMPPAAGFTVDRPECLGSGQDDLLTPLPG